MLTTAFLTAALAPLPLDVDPTPLASLEVSSAAHLVQTSAAGFSAGFQGSASDEDSSTTPARSWIRNLDSELSDGSGTLVGRGTGYQQSSAGLTRLAFALSSSAEASGTHLEAAAMGWSRYDVGFTVSTRVRYVIRAGAESSAGANASWVRLDGAQGSVLDLVPSPGSGGDSFEIGWLDAGAYTLSGRADCLAFGVLGASDQQVAHADGELQIRHAADFDLNGVVDAADRFGFQLAYRMGNPSADFDGNGQLNAADLRAYDSAAIDIDG